MLFSELGLSAKVLSAVEAAGYTEPTPIQAEAIPHVLQRKDVLGIAQTGTGKTASFTLPMLTLLERGRARARMPRTLIIEPTRELAAQVAQNLEVYGANHKLTVALLIGGVSFDEQDKKLTRGADILIATPGRLLDHFERGRLLLTGVEVLVIDEADRMLDMGFIPDIERIFKLVPFTRQTLFFSATMPPEIQRIVSEFLHNPVRIEVARASSTADTVTQRLVSSSSKPHDKRETLRGLLNNAKDLQNAIIFCNRKRDVATLHRSLERHGYNAGALHGDMDQRARMATLAAFRTGEIAMLVASDVAARGLDIPAVSHVFNFDVPTHAEDYVHRIGRTGRAGRSGAAFTIVTSADKKYLDGIQSLIKREIEWVDAPPADESDTGSDSDRGRGRGRSGGRRDAGKRETGKGEADNKAATSQEPMTEQQMSAEQQSTEGKDDTTRRSSPEKRAPRERRPSGGRARATAPEAGATEAQQERNPPPAREKRERGGRRNRGGQEREDTVVFGESEYVPDFLLRPIRKTDA